MSKQVPDQSRTSLKVCLLTIAPPAFLLAGILILLYSALVIRYNNQRRSQIAEQLSAVAEEVGPNVAAENLSRADEYNRVIVGVSILDPWLGVQRPDAVQHQEYLFRLDLNDVMATVKIPSIDVNLPIHHGTDIAILDKGVGHLFGIALPVDGESIHTVLTGHTGPGTVTIPDELTSVQTGEFFYVETASRHLKYQVTDIRVMLPNEAEPLSKVEGKDPTTLITYTPYGVNTYRFLVTGEKVPMDDGDAQVEAEQVHPRVLQPWMTAVFASAAVILCVIGWIRLCSCKQVREALEALHPLESLTVVEDAIVPNEDEVSIDE